MQQLCKNDKCSCAITFETVLFEHILNYISQNYVIYSFHVIYSNEIVKYANSKLLLIVFIIFITNRYFIAYAYTFETDCNMDNNIITF